MELISAHMNQDELMYLDILQGGPSFDDQWQIREYSKLESMFQDEEFIEEIINVLNQISETGDVKHQFERLRDAMGEEPIEFVDAPGDSSPEIKAIADLGESEGDDRIALLPPSVMDVFIQIVGDNKNAETGLNQFFFPILAAIIAGAGASSLGAGVAMTAAAAGAGSFLGSKIMGEKTGKALKGAALAGLTAGIIPHFGGAFTKAFPTIAGGISKASNAIFGPGITGALGSAITGTGPQYAAAAAEAAKNGIAGTGGAAATAPASSGIFGGSNLLPLALTGFYQHAAAKKQQKQYEKEKKEYEDSLSKRMNNNANAIEVPQYTGKQYIPQYQPNARDLTLYDQSGRLNYKGGGHVNGDSKGQEDNRSYKLREGSFVVNATNLADLGDGNSKAGSKEVNRFLSKIKAKTDGHKKTIDVLLSDGEEIIDRNKVNAIGGGSNDRGAKLLDNAFKNLRKHKVSNGLELPPKAFRLDKYLRT